MAKEKCYYVDFGTCNYRYSQFKGKNCPGQGECQYFISESDYFLGVMSGKIKDDKPREDPAVTRARIEKALKPEKSRKQQKREEKKEAEKNNVEFGFSLGDALKDILKDQ